MAGGPTELPGQIMKDGVSGPYLQLQAVLHLSRQDALEQQIVSTQDFTSADYTTQPVPPAPSLVPAPRESLVPPVMPDRRISVLSIH